MASVKMLLKRYAQATQQKLAYAETLRNLEVSSDPVRLAEWRVYEAKARAERVVDLRVMEVYEVTQEKGWTDRLLRHSPLTA